MDHVENGDQEMLAEKAGRGSASKNASEGAEAKIKLMVKAGVDHPLSRFQTTMKNRNIKGVDLGDVVAEALEAVPQEWWDQKIEAMTPLEYRVNSALLDPELRQKLSALLNPPQVPN